MSAPTVVIRVRTTLRGALEKLPSPLVAMMIDWGWLDSWPLELTHRGRRYVQVIFPR